MFNIILVSNVQQTRQSYISLNAHHAQSSCQPSTYKVIIILSTIFPGAVLSPHDLFCHRMCAPLHLPDTSHLPAPSLLMASNLFCVQESIPALLRCFFRLLEESSILPGRGQTQLLPSLRAPSGLLPTLQARPSSFASRDSSPRVLPTSPTPPGLSPL